MNEKLIKLQIYLAHSKPSVSTCGMTLKTMYTNTDRIQRVANPFITRKTLTSLKLDKSSNITPTVLSRTYKTSCKVFSMPEDYQHKSQCPCDIYMGMSRDTSSTILCGNVSECLSRTTFSGIYEPEWDSVSRNGANDIQAGQAEYPISHGNGPMTQVKPISMVSGPGALEEPHSSQGSLAFRDHLSCTWKSQPENEGKPQKGNKWT